MAETLLRLEVARANLQEGTGKGIKMALLDSGINLSHPDLKSLKLIDDIAIVEKGASFEIKPNEGKDPNGHGTVEALIMRRVAPEIELGSIAVLDEHLHSKTALICEGARLAIERGYDLIHCSFGCAILEHRAQYEAWVEAAERKGIHVVAACNNLDSSRIEWPGFFPSVFNINYCDTAEPLQFFYRPGSPVEFAAPGKEITFPWFTPEVKPVTGSSYAAAYFTGLLARLLSRSPKMNSTQLKKVMRELASME